MHIEHMGRQCEAGQARRGGCNVREKVTQQAQSKHAQQYMQIPAAQPPGLMSKSAHTLSHLQVL